MMVSAASSPVPTLLSKLGFSSKTFHADRFVWFAMYDAVSHTVNAWNANKDVAEQLGSLLNTSSMGMYCRAHNYSQMLKVAYENEENISVFGLHNHFLK